jgi:hypothetical protein
MPLVVYFDEVGNPTLDPSDKDFPVFAIALLICDSQCYINQIVPRVNQVKFDVFGHEGVILHSRDIRKAQGDFGFLTDLARRQPFYAAQRRDDRLRLQVDCSRDSQGQARRPIRVSLESL